MPLDQELISKSTIKSMDSLDKIVSTECPHLFFIEDFLDHSLLKKLINFISTADVGWVKEIDQEYLNRLKLKWVFDSVVEEVHIVLDNLTEKLNQKFNKTNKFIGLTVWKDQEGYTINPHKDNDLIDIAIQLYLTEGNIDLSTKFEYNGKILHPNYKINSGYLFDNSVGVRHYMTTPVPQNYTRFSLYAIWSKR
jgi:hypothetical protein